LAQRAIYLVLIANLEGWRALFRHRSGAERHAGRTAQRKAVADDVIAAADHATEALAEITLPLDQAVAECRTTQVGGAFAVQLVKLRDSWPGL
jgi:hypothetical protein